MKKYLFAGVLAASMVVSSGSFAVYAYNSGSACAPGYELDREKGACVQQTTTKCTSKQYILNGKCMDCQTGGVCDGTNMTCTYGYIKSNGVVSCNTAPGINPSCVNYIVKDGKCADISEMCPKGQTAKADSSGRVTCTTPSILACKTNYYIVNNACVSCPTYGKRVGWHFN